MKLMMIIAGDEYVEEITSILVDNHYAATNIGSSGDFLQYGYSILMLGIQEAEIQKVCELLNKGNDNADVKICFHGEVTIHIINIENHMKMHNLKIE